jgi:hypothetical protein
MQKVAVSTQTVQPIIPALAPKAISAACSELPQQKCHQAYYKVRQVKLHLILSLLSKLFQSNTPLACCGVRQRNFDWV